MKTKSKVGELLVAVGLFVLLAEKTSAEGAATLVIQTKSLPTQNFQLSAQLRARSAKDGGSLDGGGGNTDANKGKLLDESTQSGPSLDHKMLIAKIENTFGIRISSLDEKMPGFKSWLYAALQPETIWALDEKEMRQDICRNFKFHVGEQRVVACQSLSRVHFDKNWFETVDDDELIPKMTLHELVRYHTIRLAKEKKLSREEQDEITAAITISILDLQVTAEQLYQKLVRVGLLLNDVALQTARTLEIASLYNLYAENFNNLKSLVNICRSVGVDSKSAQDMFSRLGSVLLKITQRCESEFGPNAPMPLGECPNHTEETLARMWIEKCGWED